MPALVKVWIDLQTGWCKLRFPFNRTTMNVIREIPGARAQPNDNWAWVVPVDAWAILKDKVKHEVVCYLEGRADLDLVPSAARLRPYQRDGVNVLVRHGHYLLGYEQRVGKTPVACVAASALIRSAQVDRFLILYPGGVRGVWERHVRDWCGAEMVALEGESNVAVAFDQHGEYDQALDPRDRAERDEYRKRLSEAQFIGCHYEILGARELDLHAVLAGKTFAIIGDECHAVSNWQARRTRAAERLARSWGSATFTADEVEEPHNAPLKFARDLVIKNSGGDVASDVTLGSGRCTTVWGLTATPMRNRPMDLRAMLEFVNPGSTGARDKFGKRYAGAVLAEHGTHTEWDAEGDPHVRPGHWDFSGSSNEEELNGRLSAIMLRKFRSDADVAPHLPQTERVVILAEFQKKADQRKYETAERALATRVDLNEAEPSRESREAIRLLAGKTFAAKLPKIVERCKYHHGDGKKFIVAAHHHESLEGIVAALGVEGMLPQVFVAGGWLTPKKRERVLEEWRAAPAPAILAANKMSLLLGIDLSDAYCCIDTELEWVPADQRQWEDRIADVHLGKRTSPPLIELVVLKGTIDSAIASVMVSKLRAIDKIVPGKDVEARGLEAALVGNTGGTAAPSGVADPSRLRLPSNDEETVRSVLRAVRDRWLKGEKKLEADDAASLAAQVRADWDSEDDLESGGDTA